jgi:site-specific DNA-methyltransferase (adenine-specific)
MTVALTNEWQKVTKSWGHKFHAMCSYMGMFPARLPHYFIHKFTRPGDVVLDPFCGRGTTPLQACVCGRVGIGVDLNPLAYVLTRAKVDPPTPPELEARLRLLENDLFFSDPDGEPEQIRMLFHPKTLRQLVYLKGVLDLEDRCDAFIAATILGVLHGATNRNLDEASFLSISMPNTFSMAPNYVRNYIAAKGLKAPAVDVFRVLRRKFQRMFMHRLPPTRGFAYRDSMENLKRLPNRDLRQGNVKLVVSSPPYLKVVRYGLYNWIRLWFLDVDGAGLDSDLAIFRKMKDYLAFMERALDRIYRVLAPGGVCCLVVGDVMSRKTGESVSLADEIWRTLQESESPFRLHSIVDDRLPERSKVSKIWGDKKGQATQVDRILVLYRDSIEELTDEVDWTPPKKAKAASKPQLRTRTVGHV